MITVQHAQHPLLHDFLRSFVLLLLHLDADRQGDAALPARHTQPPRPCVAAVRGSQSQVFVLNRRRGDSNITQYSSNSSG